MDLPTEHEASLATAGKEITWSKQDRSAFQKAADEQWQKWTENGSVQELSVQESRRMQEDLTRTGKSGDLLTPRWVLTDKNAALSTPASPLPLKPSARLVVPDFKDTVHSGSVEKHGNLRETAWKDDCARMPPRRRGLRSCFCARWQRTSLLGAGVCGRPGRHATSTWLARVPCLCSSLTGGRVPLCLACVSE